ncbi:MAG: hypothetical protein GXP35_05400 [Actinobacteria bacterium]|nr:hypothetical protein [Actinomycetota bacterium]
MTTNNDQCELLRQREQLATPGPWKIEGPDDQMFMTTTIIVSATTSIDPSARLRDVDPEDIIAAVRIQGSNPRIGPHDDWDENARFICLAREMVPVLLDRISELETQLAELPAGEA